MSTYAKPRKFKMPQNKHGQLALFKGESKSYGGTLLNTRKGRPIDSKNSMHLVLRSSMAVGKWSFRAPGNQKKIQTIIGRFATKYGVKIFSLANVGNHLHFHVKLANRHAYKPFIRAITSAIAMAVTGASRWRSMEKLLENQMGAGRRQDEKRKFWDYRPFTRVIQGFRAVMGLKDYILINQFEGLGVGRMQARLIMDQQRGT